jgi:hypothetical protein
MSFIAYLCWLLGISMSGDCDQSAYLNVIEACGVTDDGGVDTNIDTNVPKDGGERNLPPHHGRTTNIDLSI